MASIFEGAVQGVVDKLRAAFAADKEHISRDLAKGSTSPAYPDQAFDLFQAYGYDALSNYLRIEHDLVSKYVDFENMDEIPEIFAVLNIYSDDATQPDSQLKRTVWVTSPDKTLQTELDDLFNRTLRMDEEISEIARCLVKYGNDFNEILVNENGVVGLNYLPAPTIRRVEGPRGELYGFVQDWRGRFGFSPNEFQQILAARNEALAGMQYQGSAGAAGNYKNPLVTALEPWEVCHFRLSGKARRTAYGQSILEGSRWIFKRLMLLEDAALIYRLQRAPERFAFYVDVGDLPPQEALAYVNKIRQRYKKKRIINSNGQLDLKYSPLSMDQDFYVPTRRGTDGARIETLGSPSWQHMDDVAYFQNKLFTALSVPKAYLAHEEGAHRAILSSEDVRFARAVLRVQRELRNGLKRIARTHLAALNIDPDKVQFEINMTIPSAIFELAQLEVRNARADLAARMREHVSLRWILENVYQLSDEDIQVIIKERQEDALRDGKVQAEIEKMTAQAQAVSAPAQPESLMRSGQLPRLTEIPGRRAGITIKELEAGSRAAEKRAAAKLDLLLRGDDEKTRRIKEIGALLHELAGTIKASVNRRAA